LQICSGGLIGGNVVVFIPNTVGREEFLERPATESARVGIDLHLHAVPLFRSSKESLLTVGQRSPAQAGWEHYPITAELP